MTDIAATLKECHRIVWDARAILEPHWPTPTTEDALLFAFTELGEAVDAHLRSKPEYARNRDKDLSVLDELADCALMLITATGPTYPDEIYIYRNEIPHDWKDYVRNMNFLMRYIGHQGIGDDLMQMVQRIATHPGMDLPARLTARLDRIKAKRLPQGEGFDEFEAYWPAVPDMQGGIDWFADHPISGLPPTGIPDFTPPPPPKGVGV